MPDAGFAILLHEQPAGEVSVAILTYAERGCVAFDGTSNSPAGRRLFPEAAGLNGTLATRLREAPCHLARSQRGAT
jgi:hypothetical protein